MTENALTRPFGREEIKQFTGRGGQLFDFVEDESVMDRLDEFYGVGNWQLLVDPIPLYEGVVKVRLGVPGGDGSFSWYEDFGYPNNGTSGEALKEAVSDGIRRCGRYLGIGRDLYRKHTALPTQTASTPAQQSQRPPMPRPAATTVPPEPDGLMDDGSAAVPPMCPAHRWPMKPARDGGWFCTGKGKPGFAIDGNGYCGERAA